MEVISGIIQMIPECRKSPEWAELFALFLDCSRAALICRNGIICRMIFNIQRCSNRDGNGLRTTVFMKGCPLSCVWCANPESQSFHREIMESESRCIGCMACARECPAEAIKIAENGYPQIDRTRCKRCFHCADICYAGSKHVVGRSNSPDAFFREIEKDRFFFSKSGGGVTFSGGEPLAQPELLHDIAKRCHESGINVMLESCGYARYEQFEKVLQYVDAMYFDVKHIDPEVHKRITGKDNRLILRNLHQISEFGIPIVVRTPVIPGYTDEEKNISGIAELIRSIPKAEGYELLAYHSLGESKYHALGRKYELHGALTPTLERMLELVDLANRVLAGSGKVCFYLE